MILAIDTTSDFGSLALLRSPGEVDEIPLHSPDGFAHILFDHLAIVLERNGIAMRDIECFAAASGPGSFTGVRVGLAAVKGLAEATGRPAVAVSTLRALASFGSRPLRAVLLDARRGQVYAAVYNEDLRIVSPEVVTALPDWIRGLPGGDLEFIAMEPAAFQSALTGARFQNAPVRTAPRYLAAAAARIAASEWKHGAAQDAAALDANYVRRSDAELFWKE